MNDLFSVIKSRNLDNGSKQVMSMSYDNGEFRTYTYDKMFSAASLFADKLIAAGVQKADRIVIVAENSPEWNIAYLSAMQLRCTAVLIDFSLPAQDILHLIENADARCIFTSPKVGAKLGFHISDTIPVLNIMDDAQPLTGQLSAIAKGVPQTSDGDSDIAFIIYSSGTTKTATGIMHTHEAMLGTTNAAIDFNNLKSDEKMLVVIPNSHIYGVVTSMLGPLILGGSMHFIESMTAENVLKAFAEYQPTVFSCVPRVFEMFQRQIVDKINKNKLTATVFKLFFPICVWLRQKAGLNLGKIIFGAVHKGFGGQIRVLCAAGAPMNPEAMCFYYGVGMNLFLNYGLTETNVPVIANSYDNYTINTCGKPYPHVELKLNLLDHSELKEIYMKSPFMMKGYFRDEEATKAAFDGEWFKTGDLAAVNSDGNISIVGRCKDNIVLATGKKVTPDDVEVGYSTLHGVKEFVVCGIPAVAGGYDEVHAFAVRDEAQGFTEADIEQEVMKIGSGLSQYMKINALHFVAEIPKTSLQKPKRYLLKAQVTAGKCDTVLPAEPVISAPGNEGDSLNTIIQLVRQVCKTELTILPETRIIEDLGLDSLGCIELDTLIQDNCGKSVVHCFGPGATVEQLAQELETGAGSTADLVFRSKFPVKKIGFDYFCFKVCSVLVRWVYKVEITGFDNIPKDGSYIICPNHQTNFDFLWVTLNFGKEQFQRLGCLAKKELFNHSFASHVLSRVCGMIPIDRSSFSSQAVSLCRQKIKEGWNFLVYPEGTRTKNGEMGEFKKGAAMLSLSENVPIIPVKIKGGFEIFPAGKKLPRLFDFKHMRRCRVEVAFATPITDYSLDVDSLNRKLRDTVASM
ncbi:MAG: AMP-binding protein [Lachnospiraceae bacterium]